MDKYDRAKRAFGFVGLGGAWGILGVICSLRIVKVFSLGQWPEAKIWILLGISAIILISLLNDYLRIAGFLISSLAFITGVVFLIIGVGLEIGWMTNLVTILLLLGFSLGYLYTFTLTGSQPTKKLYQKFFPPKP